MIGHFQRSDRRERLVFSLGPAGPGVRVPIRGIEEAMALLHDISGEPFARSALRRLYAEAVGSATLCMEHDQRVLEVLANRLSTGEIKAWSTEIPDIKIPMGALLPDAEPAPPPAEAEPAPPPPEEPPPEEPPADQGVEAEALETAAEDGTAFCEECAQSPSASAGDETLADIDLDGQAATLAEASNDGAAFCEECEKAKHAA